MVRLIFKRYLNGVSAYQLALELNDNNVPTYYNKPWSGQRILRIISNEKYMGACLMQKSYVNESGRQVKNRGEYDMFYIENHHPHIIDNEQWQQAQVIRNSRKQRYVYGKGDVK